jgi:pyridoxine 5-phosphate synthase
MTNLSVNINKVATLRNARGENVPDVQKFAEDCERFGAQGITVHPRPDERHIKRDDVFKLRPIVRTEFNIEGYPSEDFIKLVLNTRPEQVTLVPDSANVLTSSEGWDVEANMDFLTPIIAKFKETGIRTSIFVAADPAQIKAAARTGTDRVELYTKPYADNYDKNREEAVKDFVVASQCAHDAGMGVNAGHDLNLRNLQYFHQMLPYLDEVSIGHAIISDALYLGIENCIKAYLETLK